MVRRKQRDSSACPRCDAENEHLVHILSCPQHSAEETTQSLLSELEHWLIQEDTHPQLTVTLMHTITHWFHDPYDDDPIQYQTDERLRQALSNQDSIGWYAFLMGCISTYIIQYQTLLLKPILFQKKWFRVIHTGREAMRPHTVDKFTTNTALRRWIGLPPTSSA